VNDLIGLRNMGVRDSVINAMQQAPPRAAQGAVVYPGYPSPGREVIVQPVYAPWYPPPPPAFYYNRYRPHGRASWGVSFWP